MRRVDGHNAVVVGDVRGGVASLRDLGKQLLDSLAGQCADLHEERAHPDRLSTSFRHGDLPLVFEVDLVPDEEDRPAARVLEKRLDPRIDLGERLRARHRIDDDSSGSIAEVDRRQPPVAFLPRRVPKLEPDRATLELDALLCT